MDRRILQVIIERFKGGPVGLKPLSASLGEDQGTLEDLYEPFLVPIRLSDPHQPRPRRFREGLPASRPPPASPIGANDPSADQVNAAGLPNLLLRVYNLMTRQKVRKRLFAGRERGWSPVPIKNIGIPPLPQAGA